MKTTYQHWQLQQDQDRILWLTINRQDASVNSLNREVFDELSAILTVISQDKALAGVVILSGKAKGFIAGADIKQFTEIKTKQEAFTLIRQAQTILDQLAALPVPTVAMIRGFCLGGGLELALACRYRVADDGAATILGLPEVNLGLHPGWGGTVRLPRLIGAPQAMAMMLSGKPVSAVKAARSGLVDAAVPERELEKAARYYILQHPPAHQPKGFDAWSNTAIVRPWLGKIFRNKLAKKVNPAHYPAPFAIIRNWLRDGAAGEKAFINEAHSIAELMVGDTSRQLVRVFFLQDQLKAQAKNIRFKPQHVHVIGAGTMGGDIAAWCAYKGFKVTLQDKTSQQIAPAIQRAYQLFIKKFEQPRLAQAALDRLQPDTQGEGVKHADVVIEAVFEDLAVKQQIFDDLWPKLKPSAILATNTSSILLQDIAQTLANPKQLIGLHYFNPVAKMPLVEVVTTEFTPVEQMQKAASFINQLGHFPLPVSSTPGFLVNRILMPYLLEAMILFEEGVSITAIDQAAKDFGMPMGPILLADKVGLDICLSVANNLAEPFGLTVPPLLATRVQQGHLGAKSGKGFYRYTKQGEPTAASGSGSSKIKPAEITDRLILRLCNEAVACWAEKVVTSADFVDAGMIFGAGFAPFRGGPMEYIRSQGAKNLQEKLQKLAQQYGDRFKPHSGWSAL